MLPSSVFTQIEGAPAAEFVIYDVTPENFTYEFSLAIKRNAENWNRFVNGTFQFEMVEITIENGEQVETPMSAYDNTNLKFELIEAGGGTDDGFTIASDSVLNDVSISAIESYVIKTQVLKRSNRPTRLSIAIQGPPEYIDNTEIPLNTPGTDSSFYLGRFRITNLDGTFPRMEIRWLDSLNHYGSLKYLASAYKLGNSLTVQGVEDYFIADDNIDFAEPPLGITTAYRNDTTVFGTFLSSFTAQYIGAQQAVLRWRTRSEFRARSFRIFRGYKYAFEDVDAVEYEDEPFRIITKDVNDPLVRKSPFEYDTIHDEGIPAERRGWEICYKIEWEFLPDDNTSEWKEAFDDGEIGIACAGIPNAVISYGHVYPNPFRTNTTVDYTVDDDVMLTIVLYDANGREVDVLMNNQRIERGTHSLNIEFPETATNGLFNLIFYGDAINDPSVEYTRAILKMQKVR